MPVVQVLVGVSCLLRPAVAMLCSLACFCMFLLACFGCSGFVGCCWDTCGCSWIKLEPGFTNPGWAIDDPVLLLPAEILELAVDLFWLLSCLFDDCLPGVLALTWGDATLEVENAPLRRL